MHGGVVSGQVRNARFQPEVFCGLSPDIMRSECPKAGGLGEFRSVPSRSENRRLVHADTQVRTDRLGASMKAREVVEKTRMRITRWASQGNARNSLVCIENKWAVS